MVEGKLSIWIKSGSFSHASDLFVQVMVDDNTIWKTDEKDGYSPDWDSTVSKHIKGDYEKLILKLMDEDTCTLLHAASSILTVTFLRDDTIGTSEFSLAEVCSGGLNESVELCDADGNPVGTVDVNINFEEGDVSFFDMLGSMLHKED